LTADLHVPYDSLIDCPAVATLLFEGIPADKTDKVYGEGYVYRCADWTWVRGYYPKKIRYWQDAYKPWHGDRNSYLYVDDSSMLRDGTLTGEEENVGVRVICDPAA